MDMSLSKLQELVMDRDPGVLQSIGSDWATELNWTELILYGFTYFVLNVSHSVMSDSEMLWTVANQGSLSMGFSRQEY